MGNNINIIVAHSLNGGIGKDNKLLWKLKEDMDFFKNITTDNTVIMGRKTYESIGALPNRVNIILTKKLNYKAKGCIVTNSMGSAISKCSGNREIFIIGGGEIYKEGLKYVNTCYITKVNDNGDIKDTNVDTFFSQLNSDWTCINEDKFIKSDTNDYDFTICTYVRN